MKLLNHLYSIDTIAQSDEGIICTIRLIAGSPIYKAHFPMQPITPGACVVQMAVELYQRSKVEGLRSKAGRMQLSIVKVKSAKFLHAMIPGGDRVFRYLIKQKTADQGEIQLLVVVTSDDVPYAKLSLVCKEI
jgi:3-hydroxyacyl-[acyl-carrier-protein] dehydratase